MEGVLHVRNGDRWEKVWVRAKDESLALWSYNSQLEDDCPEYLIKSPKAELSGSMFTFHVNSDNQLYEFRALDEDLCQRWVQVLKLKDHSIAPFRAVKRKKLRMHATSSSIKVLWAVLGPLLGTKEHLQQDESHEAASIHLFLNLMDSDVKVLRFIMLMMLDENRFEHSPFMKSLQFSDACYPLDERSKLALRVSLMEINTKTLANLLYSVFKTMGQEAQRLAIIMLWYNVRHVNPGLHNCTAELMDSCTMCYNDQEVFCSFLIHNLSVHEHQNCNPKTCDLLLKMMCSNDPYGFNDSIEFVSGHVQSKYLWKPILTILSTMQNNNTNKIKILRSINLLMLTPQNVLSLAAYLPEATGWLSDVYIACVNCTEMKSNIEWINDSKDNDDPDLESKELSADQDPLKLTLNLCALFLENTFFNVDSSRFKMIIYRLAASIDRAPFDSEEKTYFLRALLVATINHLISSRSHFPSVLSFELSELDNSGVIWRNLLTLSEILKTFTFCTAGPCSRGSVFDISPASKVEDTSFSRLKGRSLKLSVNSEAQKVNARNDVYGIHDLSDEKGIGHVDYIKNGTDPLQCNDIHLWERFECLLSVLRFDPKDMFYEGDRRNSYTCRKLLKRHRLAEDIIDFLIAIRTRRTDITDYQVGCAARRFYKCKSHSDRTCIILKVMEGSSQDFMISKQSHSNESV